MKYKVRTKEGELDFKSFGEVERMWLLGFIEPDDEVLEEGKTLWRKAGSIPLLVQARRTGEQAWGGSWLLWTMAGIVGATAALVMLGRPSREDQLIGGLLALVTAGVTIHVNVRAHRRSKPNA